LGTAQPRDDKVLDPHDAKELLQGIVRVEEKVDGANLGFSTTADGELQVQNRGSYLSRESCHPQFTHFWSWLGARKETISNALWPNRMLFGEWCFAVHSLRYTRLPDWFLGFDVYDQTSHCFLDASGRDQLLSDLGLSSVPGLFQGRTSLGDLLLMLESSKLRDGKPEGIVIRKEHGGRTIARAKLVRAEFIQSIGEHWSRRQLERNSLKDAPQWP
jgi:hypothetical protein